ncbi:phosphate uptake regulator PhoU [archaeon]|jgi:phosphate uptake regulator|nr:phosphate uptake regulator PhoU [archaeon]MBT4023171.1 phosphate uptake regulator PhoU [archaeon]MBT4272377.1 phosphate uptake regulator PhoU [archaeon]MBT4460714.1 phosphate uptake regulator PhoU [archaeon]MBT4859146.1 phosphate uptake regulator PhoU [archaeon]
MIRKVSKVGQSSLVVSLPSKWVKLYGIKKGDEVDIKSQGRSLQIITEKISKGDKTQIDITNMGSSLVWKHVVGAYKRGFKEIKIKFSGESIKVTDKFYKRKHLEVISPYELINQISNSLIGIEVVDQGSNFCTIKQLATINDDEFNTTFRRVFLLIKSMLSDIISNMKNSENINLDSIFFTDESINKFSIFCIRILSHRGYIDSLKVELFYDLINSLESIGDEIKILATKISKKDTTLILPILESLLESYDLFYTCFYNYEKHKVETILNSTRDIKRSCDKLLTKHNSESINSITNHIKNITKIIRDQTQSIIELNFSINSIL